MHDGASKSHRLAGALMVVAALAYLVPFVPRGWIPHDEGMLGQSADLVLQGAIPHIDYEEAYTGGLSWLYAAVFKLAGVDLLHLRWMLFAGAAIASWAMYSIFRRFVAPAAAAVATWVAVVWSFPNYFAGLPSWWLLICALATVWAWMRYTETQQWWYVAVAGLAAGMAMAIKQTGAYLLVAVVLSILYDGGRPGRSLPASVERFTRIGAAIVAMAAAAAILRSRLAAAEGLYLFLPAAACALVVLWPRNDDTIAPGGSSPLALVAIATVAAALPLLCLLIPYILQDRVWDFVNGTLILPQKRLAFASTPMRGAWAIVTGVPFIVLVVGAFGTRVVAALLWTAAVALPVLAVWNGWSYQAIWQSSRAVAALLPIAVCWRLMSGRIHDWQQRSMLFGATAVLAWMSLNQFPFAAPIYFCYVAPLAVVAVVSAAHATASLHRHTLLPWGVLLLLFGIVSANRGYIESLGVNHDPRRFDTALRLPRAHLRVTADDARVYRRLMFTLAPLVQAGRLVAGPDCPQVYFLAGRTSPSGALFDFFSADAAGDNGGNLVTWQNGDVIVLNHAPHFSPAPPEPVVARLRRTFQFGEQIGSFEVRWR